MTVQDEYNDWFANRQAMNASLPVPTTVSVGRKVLIDGAVASDDLTNCQKRTLTRVAARLTIEWTRPNTTITGRSKGDILYIHGAVQTGSAASYRPIAAQLAKSIPASVAVLNYRRPPETAFPAPYNDVLTALDYLETHSHPMKRLVLAGDSFGAMPLLAAVIKRRNTGKTLPKAIYLLCPDADYSNRTFLATRPYDPNPDTCAQVDALNQYFRDPDYPCTGMTASPSLDDLSGLPPILMHESRDFPLTHATQLRDRLYQVYGDNGTFFFRDWPFVPHIFPTYRVRWFPTYGAEAIVAAAAWIATKLT